MHIDRNQALRTFRDYVAAYDATNPRIALKIDHTLRVAGICDRIATGMGMDASDADIAWMLGLLHDIGRFEQVRRWGTFADARSCDHAALGVEVLRTDGLLRRFIPEGEDDLVITAVRCHNALRLPEDLDERTRLFCDLLRDADKLDILHAAVIEPTTSIYGEEADIILGSAISDEAWRGFQERRCLARDERHEPADKVVGFACFIWELTCPPSFGLALELGDVFILLGQGFTNPDTRRKADLMAAELRGWLEARGTSPLALTQNRT